ncbi:unnamed protein product [Boreogadus saida]
MSTVMVCEGHSVDNRRPSPDFFSTYSLLNASRSPINHWLPAAPPRPPSHLSTPNAPHGPPPSTALQQTTHFGHRCGFLSHPETPLPLHPTAPQPWEAQSPSIDHRFERGRAVVLHGDPGLG